MSKDISFAIYTTDREIDSKTRSVKTRGKNFDQLVQNVAVSAAIHGQKNSADFEKFNNLADSMPRGSRRIDLAHYVASVLPVNVDTKTGHIKYSKGRSAKMYGGNFDETSSDWDIERLKTTFWADFERENDNKTVVFDLDCLDKELSKFEESKNSKSREYDSKVAGAAKALREALKAYRAASDSSEEYLESAKSYSNVVE